VREERYLQNARETFHDQVEAHCTEELDTRLQGQHFSEQSTQPTWLLSSRYFVLYVTMFWR
jgi:hypothetical protein